MDKILLRLAMALRSILHIPKIELDIEQIKVSLEEQKILIEEQELRTTSTLVLLANHQQQLGEQIEGLKKILLAQLNSSITDDCTCNNKQSRKLAASMDGLTNEIRKFSVVIDGPISLQSETRQDDDYKI